MFPWMVTKYAVCPTIVGDPPALPGCGLFHSCTPVWRSNAYTPLSKVATSTRPSAMPGEPCEIDPSGSLQRSAQVRSSIASTSANDVLTTMPSATAGEVDAELRATGLAHPGCSPRTVATPSF